jgi:ABC-type transport system involved in Fe-S cluster assembly fused permease/ATPase subunit
MDSGNSTLTGYVPPAVDTASALSILITYTGWLPTALTLLATLFSIIWFAIQIYDWYARRRQDRAALLAARVVEKAAEVAKNVLAAADEKARK